MVSHIRDLTGSLGKGNKISVQFIKSPTLDFTHLKKKEREGK